MLIGDCLMRGSVIREEPGALRQCRAWTTALSTSHFLKHAPCSNFHLLPPTTTQPSSRYLSILECCFVCSSTSSDTASRSSSSVAHQSNTLVSCSAWPRSRCWSCRWRAQKCCCQTLAMPSPPSPQGVLNDAAVLLCTGLAHWARAGSKADLLLKRTNASKAYIDTFS